MCLKAPYPRCPSYAITHLKSARTYLESVQTQTEGIRANYDAALVRVQAAEHSHKRDEARRDGWVLEQADKRRNRHEAKLEAAVKRFNKAQDTFRLTLDGIEALEREGRWELAAEYRERRISLIAQAKAEKLAKVEATGGEAAA